MLTDVTKKSRELRVSMHLGVHCCVSSALERQERARAWCRKRSVITSGTRAVEECVVEWLHCVHSCFVISLSFGNSCISLLHGLWLLFCPTLQFSGFLKVLCLNRGCTILRGLHKLGFCFSKGI